MAYPNSVDDLTSGVPSDGLAPTTPLGSNTYPHDDHHRALGVAVEAMQTQTVGAFVSYTPTLTCSGVTPVNLGTGSSVYGYYKQRGRMVTGYAKITFGTVGVNAGTGYYGLSLPVEPVNREQPIGIGYLIDISQNARTVIATAAISPAAFWSSSTSKAIIIATNVTANTGFSSGDNPVGATVPWTWEASDQIALQFNYETAAAG